MTRRFVAVLDRALGIVLGFVLGFVACGTPAPNKLNQRPSPLHAIKAPHIPLFVRTDEGLVRVFLDTGARDIVSRSPHAIVVDTATFVYEEDGRFVIERGGERTPLDGVQPATQGNVRLSPDRRVLAVSRAIEPAPLDKTQPDQEIVTFVLADATLRRYPMPNVGPQSPSLSFVWAQSGDALIVTYDVLRRLDLASGTMTPIDRADYAAQTHELPLNECPSLGVRLAHRAHKDRQEIVLVPTSSLQDPEHLSATTDRVLVTATNNRRALGMGGPHLGPKRAGPLEIYGFTPGCEHFVFSLEGGVYVGSVKTGRYALVIEGSQPELLRTDARVLRQAAP
ncbi:MAG TPA: hypothetical protein VIV11_37545 [Kofleriaceae bacterium]